MSIPSPRKTLELLRKVLGTVFLLIGTLMLLLPQINGFISPVKEISGFIIILIGIYLLFRGII